MDKFIILFYVILAMSFLLNAVFIWGAITYKKVKTDVKFLNTPLLTLTFAIAGLGFILAWVPIVMKIWTYDPAFITSDPLFLSILIFEILFLLAFLVLAYMFAFDFGMALEKDKEQLQFFGQAVDTNKIITLEEKKYSLKIVYEQGFKNIKKKITVFTPNAKKFVREILTDIVAVNQKNKQAQNIENTIVEELTNSKNLDSEKNS